MSLRFIIGPSGSGKSTYICEKTVKAAEDNPRQSYLVIVPDQFTMQTQMDFVKKSSAMGIMNIEVLSFLRLAHRVFEQTGGGNVPVLDDTGKNLILRRLASEAGDRIPYLAGKLNKPGFIHEVKSAISEFMQYEVDNEKLNKLIEYSEKGNKITLVRKLRDLSVLYGLFEGYIKDRYITTEEAMDVLAREIYKCHIVQDSIVIFDGFTGFTPIQNKVLDALMDVAKDIEITLTLEDIGQYGESPTGSVNESDLFALTGKTYMTLKKMADRKGIPVETIYTQAGKRYVNSPELSFLERQLYRGMDTVYEGECRDIRIASYKTIRDDVRGLASGIDRLVKEDGACYRDIAVITGNLDAYAGDMEEILDDYGIPYYMDRNKGIIQNPFAEYVKSALDIIVSDYSYESVFRFLRTGFAGMSSEDTDILDNYVRAAGIKGMRAYLSPFYKTTRQMRTEGDAAQELERLNDIRLRFTEGLKPVTDAGLRRNKKLTAAKMTEALYDFIRNNRCSEKLRAYSLEFDKEGDYTSSREYAQIYELTMKLLEQIHELIGEETMEPDEFLKLIEAGFDEIEVGTIPQSVDRVIIGDMERSRLKPVKYLFFLGLNDGWVPKDTGKGGLISDGDREFLNDCDIELSPSPRSKVYIDRFYLYCNLTKPSDKLFLSYVTMDDELRAVRPSDVIVQIESLFPSVVRQTVRFDDQISAACREVEVREAYAGYIRRFASGIATEDDMAGMRQAAEILKNDSRALKLMTDNAFYSYDRKTLSPYIAGLLYGSRLYTSISRLETFAGCAYSYFLKYGMGLKEREIYGIEATDMGSIYHGVLEIFNGLLKEKGMDWFDFDDETAEELIEKAVDIEAARYTDALLFENEQNRYIVDRMKKVMLKTVRTLAYQLKKGEFRPYDYEYEFEREVGTDITSLKVKGKIDRLDLDVKDDRVLIKVVDYKSGNKDFSLMSFYQGVQLQMVVYMNAAKEAVGREYPGREIRPAAMLYYHIDDPLIAVDKEESDEAISAKILKALRTKGLVDISEDIIHSLDTSDTPESDVIPVSRGKNGHKSSSRVISEEGMRIITEYADKKLMELSERMAGGDIGTKPFEIRKSASNTEYDSCRYCEYAGVCGFDPHMPGYEKRIMYADSDDTLLDKMSEELKG